LTNKPTPVVLNDSDTALDDSLQASYHFRHCPTEEKGIKLFSSSNEIIPEPLDGKYFKIHRYYKLPDLTRGKVPF
jgi:hypothetical protein